MHNRIKRANHTIHFQIMYNECSSLLKSTVADNGITFQLVPPYYHRQSPAERAIQAFKHHLIVGLASTNPKFPLYLWDKIVPQVERTLNMLRLCGVKPLTSVDTYLNDLHDYNKVPMAPPGTKLLIHEALSKRRTWVAHGVKG